MRGEFIRRFIHRIFRFPHYFTDIAGEGIGCQIPISDFRFAIFFGVKQAPAAGVSGMMENCQKGFIRSNLNHQSGHLITYKMEEGRSPPAWKMEE